MLISKKSDLLLEDFPNFTNSVENSLAILNSGYSFFLLYGIHRNPIVALWLALLYIRCDRRSGQCFAKISDGKYHSCF